MSFDFDSGPSSTLTPPADLSPGQVQAIQQGAGLNNPLQFRTDNGPLFRLDSRQPKQIFPGGFQTLNPNGTDLLNFLDNNTPSNFVSTTRTSSNVVFDLAPNGGRVRFQFLIDHPGGIDIDATFAYGIPTRSGAPALHQNEVTVVGGIPGDHVLGVRPVINQGPADNQFGTFIPNPNARPVSADELTRLFGNPTGQGTVSNQLINQIFIQEQEAFADYPAQPSYEQAESPYEQAESSSGYPSSDQYSQDNYPQALGQDYSVEGLSPVELRRFNESSYGPYSPGYPSSGPSGAQGGGYQGSGYGYGPGGYVAIPDVGVLEGVLRAVGEADAGAVVGLVARLRDVVSEWELVFEGGLGEGRVLPLAWNRFVGAVAGVDAGDRGSVVGVVSALDFAVAALRESWPEVGFPGVVEVVGAGLGVDRVAAVVGGGQDGRRVDLFVGRDVAVEVVRGSGLEGEDAVAARAFVGAVYVRLAAVLRQRGVGDGVRVAGLRNTFDEQLPESVQGFLRGRAGDIGVLVRDRFLDRNEVSADLAGELAGGDLLDLPTDPKAPGGGTLRDDIAVALGVDDDAMEEGASPIRPSVGLRGGGDSRRHSSRYQSSRHHRSREPHSSSATGSGWSRFVPTPRTLSEFLPASQRWTLYINDQDHDMARYANPSDPGRYYDNDQSPGYQRSMENAFRRILNSGVGQRMTARRYKAMHETVVEFVEVWDSAAEAWGSMGSEWSPVEGLGGTTSPPRGVPAADLFEERIGSRPLVRDGAGITPEQVLDPSFRLSTEPVALLVDFSEHGVDGSLWVSRYTKEEALEIADTIFDQMYAEIDGANGDHDGMLRGIARAVRNLHVAHLFNDANARLNIQVLLQKLLMDQGFKPVMFPNMMHSFNGAKSQDTLVRELSAAQNRVWPVEQAAADPLVTQMGGLSLGSTSTGYQLPPPPPRPAYYQQQSFPPPPPQTYFPPPPQQSRMYFPPPPGSTYSEHPSYEQAPSSSGGYVAEVDGPSYYYPPEDQFAPDYSARAPREGVSEGVAGALGGLYYRSPEGAAGALVTPAGLVLDRVTGLEMSDIAGSVGELPAGGYRSRYLDLLGTVIGEGGEPAEVTSVDQIAGVLITPVTVSWTNPVTGATVTSVFGSQRYRLAGASTPTTRVVVATAFMFGPGVSAREAEHVYAELRAGLQETFNDPQFRFRTGPVGDRLVVAVVAPSAELPVSRPVTLVRPGPDAPRMDQFTWWVAQPRRAYVHEFGHQLTMRDEYTDGVDGVAKNVLLEAKANLVPLDLDSGPGDASR